MCHLLMCTVELQQGQVLLFATHSENFSRVRSCFLPLTPKKVKRQDLTLGALCFYILLN